MFFLTESHIEDFINLPRQPLAFQEPFHGEYCLRALSESLLAEASAMNSACYVALTFVGSTAELLFALMRLWLWHVLTMLEDYAEMRFEAEHTIFFGYSSSEVDVYDLLGHQGLASDLLKRLPAMRVAQAKAIYGDTITDDSLDEGCSICLESYEGEDDIRLLPSCEHHFHKKCVDKWLGSHTTCPMCRTRVSDRRKEPVCKSHLQGRSIATASSVLATGQWFPRAVALSRA